MAKNSCPSLEQFRQLLVGQLSEKQAESLEQHLRECPSCARSVEALKVEDTLEKSVRQGHKVLRQAEQVTPAGLLNKLQNLGGRPPAP